MRRQVLAGTVLVACAAGCDPCHRGGRSDFYDEIWAMNGHNMVVQIFPERMPFDLLLERMDSIDAEFRCFSEDEQRELTEEDCYRVKLPWDVCWDVAGLHFAREYVEGLGPMSVTSLAEPPEDRCDCAGYRGLSALMMDPP